MYQIKYPAHLSTSGEWLQTKVFTCKDKDEVSWARRINRQIDDNKGNSWPRGLYLNGKEIEMQALV
jgi:hypothetical protein